MKAWSHKLLIFTDLHLTEGDTPIIGLSPSDRFQDLLDQALARHPDADALFLLGDLAHHGHPDAYKRLSRILQRVPMPVVPLMGNHDNRETFLEAFPDTPTSEGGFIQSSHQFGDWRVITLDTLDAPPYPDGHHSGFLCESRLNWLDSQLKIAKDQPVLVCLHHPPFATGIVGMDLIPLTNGDTLLQMLAGHGNVQLLCGHVHRTMSGLANGIPWAMFKSPCHQGYLDLETPDTTISIDEPGAYGVVLLSGPNAVIHHEDRATGGDVVLGYAAPE